VVALTGNSNAAEMIAQGRQLKPQFVAMADAAAAATVSEALTDTGIVVGSGAEAVMAAAEMPADWVMAAIVGAAGLAPTLAAVKHGTTVALANKESLVCAGHLFTEATKAVGGRLLPVDSEHNAIFQVFDFARPETIARIILTASGGPFRTWSQAEMQAACLKDALNHPNWDMGAKITIDSATMFNKGLELIEASHLFPVEANKIEVLVHPQSIIHSMVEYRDGSTLAQLGLPDMRTPIAVTLYWPNRAACAQGQLNLATIGQLTFETPDDHRFPALRLARAALEAGGTAPAILNAANEVAVNAFLAEEIGFLDIASVVESCLAIEPAVPLSDLQVVWAADKAARMTAKKVIARQPKNIVMARSASS
ncbi:MAG: 1-deoxy-D-xylulose-5-phosphate reductoisomerase, partial [Proteobacteria bacterium]|nr:1-deoxy-D-xylulose-5-phosphate reductoisomerase [Pseudomonadota bacterium]